MLSLFRVSTTLPRKLEELGVSPALVLRHAGLPPGLLNQEKILVSTEEFFADRTFVTHNADLFAAVAPAG